MAEPRRIEINRVYWPLLDCQTRFIVLYGGAGSGKSVFAAQRALLRCMSTRGLRYLVVRKVAKTIYESCFALLKGLIAQWGIEDKWGINEQKMLLRYRPMGSELISVGMDDREKLKSIYRCGEAWLEEPTELSQDDLTQIDLRVRGVDTPGLKQLTLTFNPINERHWLRKQFFLTPDPTEATILRTTWRDNAFIDDEYKGRLLRLARQSAQLYRVYGLGEWGRIEGAVYDAPDTTSPWPERFDEEFYGLDFGFNNPMALVWCGVKDGHDLYAREMVYRSNMTMADLKAEMTAVGVRRDLTIYCDAAEPDRIEDLRRAGWRVEAARKGPRSVKDGIDFVKTLRLHVRPDESPNLIKELGGYVWRQARDGTWLDEPVAFLNHLLDALRYAAYSRLWRPTMRAGDFASGQKRAVATLLSRF